MHRRWMRTAIGGIWSDRSSSVQSSGWRLRPWGSLRCWEGRGLVVLGGCLCVLWKSASVIGFSPPTALLRGPRCQFLNSTSRSERWKRPCPSHRDLARNTSLPRRLPADLWSEHEIIGASSAGPTDGGRVSFSTEENWAVERVDGRRHPGARWRSRFWWVEDVGSRCCVDCLIFGTIKQRLVYFCLLDGSSAIYKSGAHLFTLYYCDLL